MKYFKSLTQSFRGLSPKGQRSMIGIMIYSLCAGLVFWWAIEQLFINQLDPDNGVQLRGYALASFTVVFTLINLPLGSFSDRFGRRLSMVIAGFGRAVVFLLLGLSTEPWHYVAAAGLYGLIEAFDEGANEAYIYDTLKDEGKSRSFARINGLNEALFLIGAAIANIGSGLIAEFVSLEAAYFAAIPTAIIGGAAALRLMHEPTHHRDNGTGLWTKMKQGSHAVAQPKLIILAIAAVAGSILLEMPSEFAQAQFTEISDSAIGISLYWALGALLLAAGAAIAHKLQTYNRELMLAAGLMAVVMLGIGGWAGLAIVTVIFVIGQILEINIEAAVQDETQSSMRSTVSSVIGTGSGLILVVLFLLGGWLGEMMSVHRAIALIIVPAALIGTLALIRHRS